MSLHESRTEFVARSIINARKSYDDGSPYITDEHYDELMATLEELDPNHPALNRHQTPVSTGDVTMPFCLPSLAKVRPENGCDKWLSSSQPVNGFILSAKLDGLAAQAIYEDGKLSALYSSSDDGYTGKDITHMAAHIKGLPQTIPYTGYFAVRLELVVSKQDFKKVEGKYKNARNLASGIKNATKGLHEHISLLSAVALSVLKPRYAPKDGFDKIKELGFEVARHKHVQTTDSEELSRLFQNLKDKYKYPVDGVVVDRNVKTKVPDSVPSSTVAFKNNLLLDKAEAKVIDVIWEASRYGKLTPVAVVEPVELEGTTVRRATCHNARFVIDNRIGKGAVVHLIKSGSIIPKIEGVIKQSKVNPLKTLSGYHWNESGVDIFLNNGAEATDDAVTRSLSHFFSVLGVDGLRLATLRTVYDAGYRTEADIFNMTKGEWVELLGKNGEKIFHSVQDSLTVTLPELAYASGKLGRGMGRSKIYAIYEWFGSVESFLAGREMAHGHLVSLARPIVGPKTANLFADTFHQFLEYAFALKQEVPALRLAEVEQTEAAGSELEGFNVCFTGVRDAALEKDIVAHGGSIASGVTKFTTHLVVKDASFSSSKTEKAAKLGVKVLSVTEFWTLLRGLIND
jgi:DNA ligase (NAD+)